MAFTEKEKIWFERLYTKVENMDVKLEAVEECKKDVLYRLLQYSLFEESLNDQNDMNEDALFEYPWFENYFTEKGREACFIPASNEPSGHA